MVAKLSSKDIGYAMLPTDNPEGVPVLRLDLQATQLDLPFRRWGRDVRKSRMNGTWHMYTEDYRFSRLWLRPTDLTNSGCVSSVEANFSVTPDTPYALALYQTYRKRWLARTWQDLGSVRIFVDLNVAKEHRDTNMLGVPNGWKAYCNRGSMHRLGELVEEYELACERAGSSSPLYVVYGGGAAVQELAMRRGWIWHPEESDSVRHLDETTGNQGDSFRPLSKDVGTESEGVS